MQGGDETGARFAALTGLLEDAASLAAEGQNPGLTIVERCAFVTEIRQILNQAGLTLDDLDSVFELGGP